MVVKSKRGRRRYVAFEVSPGLRKDALIGGLVSVDRVNPPYVIQLTRGKAIIRCAPENREDTILAVSKVDPSSVPLITSGTIRKIRELYPSLQPEKR